MSSSGVVVFNAGSSSIKFAVYVAEGDALNLRFRGQVDGIGVRPQFVAKNAEGKVFASEEFTKVSDHDHAVAIQYLMSWIGENLKGVPLALAGHRVVHGGEKFSHPVVIDDEVLKYLSALVPLAPLHQPHNLAAIEALRIQSPGLKQVACFDTAFHRSNPTVHQHFFLPKKLEAEGVRRYGFHGLSYEFIAEKLTVAVPDIALKKVVIAHLGSGASMCAIENGKSVASSMGLTALEGLPMGTRPGSLDPGVVLYLLREKKMSLSEVEQMLYKESGLLGLSGVSNDLRVLEKSSDPQAKLAIDAFVWRVCQMTMSLAADLEGLDALVFTAGIGENSMLIREMVCRRLAWAGVDFDQQANDRGGPCLSHAKSRVSAWVFATDEELMIARAALKLKIGRAD